MNFNYNLEIDNILNKIYKKKVFEYALKNNISNIDTTNLQQYNEEFKSFDVYLGSEMEEFIKDSLPKDLEGYFLRCNISKHKNIYFPRLYDASGNKLTTISDSKYAILLWEGHVNDMIIEDVYSAFTKEKFNNYIDNNLENIYKEINEFVLESKNNNKLTIAFNNKSDLVNVLKEMILKNEISMDIVQDVIDLEKLREDMLALHTPIDMYNEYDKLEDELEYCVNNYFKYNHEELYDFLVNNKGFNFVENVGLVK